MTTEETSNNQASEASDHAIGPMLVDLARYAVQAASDASEFGKALRQRMNRPSIGDVVIEVTKFGFDPDSIGVLEARIKDLANPKGDDQHESEYLWVVRSLASGKSHNWGSCEFLAVPTKALRDEVRAFL